MYLLVEFYLKINHYKFCKTFSIISKLNNNKILFFLIFLTEYFHEIISGTN